MTTPASPLVQDDGLGFKPLAKAPRVAPKAQDDGLGFKPQALPQQPAPAMHAVQPNEDDIKRKYGLPATANLSKEFLDESNRDVRDPMAFSRAYQEMHPPKPRAPGFLSNAWQETKDIAKGMFSEPTGAVPSTDASGALQTARSLRGAATSARQGRIGEAAMHATEAVPMIGQPIAARIRQAQSGDAKGALGAGLIDASMAALGLRGMLGGALEETAAAPEATSVRPIGALPSYRESIITPPPRGSVIGSIDRAGPIPLGERAPMLGYARRAPIGLLPSIRPTFEDTLNSYEGPSSEPLITPEPARTIGGAIIGRGNVLGAQKALPPVGLPLENEFLGGKRTPTPRLPSIAPRGVLEELGPREALRGGRARAETSLPSDKELGFEPLPEPQPINPQEAADLSRERGPGRAIGTGRVNEIRKQQAIENNIGAGLRGDRQDLVEQIREPYRAQLGKPAAPVQPNALPPEIQERAESLVREAANFFGEQERPKAFQPDLSYAPGDMIPAIGRREQDATPWVVIKSQRNSFPWFEKMNETPGQLIKAVARGKGPAWDRLVQSAGDYLQKRQVEAKPILDHYAPEAKSLAEQVRSIDPELAGHLDSLGNGEFPAYDSLYDFAKLAEGRLNDAKAAAEFNRELEKLAAEERDSAGEGDEAVHEPSAAHGQEGIIPGLEHAAAEQAHAAAITSGENLTKEVNRPLGSIESAAGEMETKSPLFRGTEASPQGEIFGKSSKLHSGFDPTMAAALSRKLGGLYREHVAEPLISKLGLGEKYEAVRNADPEISEQLHALDNAPAYLRAKAAKQVHTIIGSLSRDQERLFSLMADADSRENLRANHPNEYRQAVNDPAIQDALRKYRPIEQEMTKARKGMGGATLDQDYLRRVYEQHVSGVGKEAAATERTSVPFERVIRPERLPNQSREATAEYHYQNGLHEFGPAFGTKFIGTHLQALRDSIAKGFISKATELSSGALEPRSIEYNGKRYYRTDIAREMGKGTPTYSRYDATAGLKFPGKADLAKKYLGPSEIVRALNNYGVESESQPGAVNRFLQEQVVGFGFGAPHVANILRRVTQSEPGGALNPKSWANAWKVALDKGLRERGIKGLDDPTFDKLAKQGAIAPQEMKQLKQYIGGNVNPANWLRALAGVGHKVLFDPHSFGGFGGIDQRARIWTANLVKSERPELSDAQIARAVNTQLGDYNRKNWSNTQKQVGKFMLFPGWSLSSLRWVIEHPIKTTVPPALLVLAANQILHQFGQNTGRDARDIQNIHLGNRSIGLTILRESMARNLERPALNYAESKLLGESPARNVRAAGEGLVSGAGGVASTLNPMLTGAASLATNRQDVFSRKELFGKGDWTTPGVVLPNKALDNLASLTVRHAFPALDRILQGGDVDFASFAGGNLGATNYKYGPEDRLKRNAAESAEVYTTISRLAKSDPQAARKFIQDPDNAALALFHSDLEHMATTLQRINAAEQRVKSAPKLSPQEKQQHIAQMERAKQNLLRNADGLDRRLFQRERAQGHLPRPIGLPASLGNRSAQGSLTGTPRQ